MASKLSDEFVFDYFSQLNSITHKIQSEISETISNYEGYWQQLSGTEKYNLINETILKPEVLLNYVNDEGSQQDQMGMEKSLLNYFRTRKSSRGDEHNLQPFSYKTKSQLNLAALDQIKDMGSGSDLKKPVIKKEELNFISLNLKKSGISETTKPKAPNPPTTTTTIMPPINRPASVIVPNNIQANTKEESENESESVSILKHEEEELSQTEPSENGDELKALLDNNKYDFLNNW